MSKNLLPTFKIARNEKDLEPLRGSKFAYSDMQKAYEKVSKELEKGKVVLFVGLPCQVQAVRNVFGDNPLLYTADIICNGMPSEGVYRKYLEDLSQEKKVVDLRFRCSDVH